MAIVPATLKVKKSRRLRPANQITKSSQPPRAGSSSGNNMLHSAPQSRRSQQSVKQEAQEESVQDYVISDDDDGYGTVLYTEQYLKSKDHPATSLRPAVRSVAVQDPTTGAQLVARAQEHEDELDEWVDQIREYAVEIDATQISGPAPPTIVVQTMCQQALDDLRDILRPGRVRRATEAIDQNMYTISRVMKEFEETPDEVKKVLPGYAGKGLQILHHVETHFENKLKQPYVVAMEYVAEKLTAFSDRGVPAEALTAFAKKAREILSDPNVSSRPLHLRGLVNLSKYQGEEGRHLYGSYPTEMAAQLESTLVYNPPPPSEVLKHARQVEESIRMQYAAATREREYLEKRQAQYTQVQDHPIEARRNPSRKRKVSAGDFDEPETPTDWYAELE